MKRASTIFLRIAVIFLGLVALALYIFALPAIYKGGSAEFPMASLALLIIVCILYAMAIPFFIALWQTLKLLSYIDHNRAFSDLSVQALNNIKYCASIYAVLAFVCVPLVVPIADADDAPGAIVYAAALACAPVAVAVFAAILQKLLREALDIKSENDLTV
ncbi:MAG: DUF2975 domain-containing protein [Candidatus Komeilibacteria bacterium]|nr:DUF2975 domain-containing protein [Candidatus Komeilibacteria bacterium]